MELQEHFENQKHEWESALQVNAPAEEPVQVNPKALERMMAKRQKLMPLDYYVEGILQGDIVVLSKAITLVESALLEHQKMAQDIIAACLPHSGNAIRLGITGVPGAGKTLVGLNIAIQRSNAQKGEHAVFFSGNFPLVAVLQEALARDKVEQAKQRGERIAKTAALRETSAFIQIIHKYRDSFVDNDDIPPERVAIFDEAQRAWTHKRIADYLKRGGTYGNKLKVPNFPVSESAFLIWSLDQREDWATIVCLVGGGQEINTGEAGISEWINALNEKITITVLQKICRAIPTVLTV